MSSADSQTPIATAADWFNSTHWSTVLNARPNPSPAAAKALERLCRTYWPPLYSYVRRKGHSPAEAEDLVQEFFARLLEKNVLADVDPVKGKFRSFLLAAMNHFVANQWDKLNAQKRGGRCSFISLNENTAELQYAAQPAAGWPAEKLFDRHWAVTILDQALVRLRDDFASAGKSRQFESLKVFLAREGTSAEYAVIGGELEMAPGAVAVTVHRLRQKFRSFIRAEIAQTLADPSEIDSEMRYLLEVLILNPAGD